MLKHAKHITTTYNQQNTLRFGLTTLGVVSRANDTNTVRISMRS
jgi:hypothetical protein